MSSTELCFISFAISSENGRLIGDALHIFGALVFLKERGCYLCHASKQQRLDKGSQGKGNAIQPAWRHAENAINVKCNP